MSKDFENEHKKFEKMTELLSKTFSLGKMWEDGLPDEMFKKLNSEMIAEYFGYDPNADFVYDNVSSFCNGYAFVTINGNCGIIDSQGEWKIKPFFKELKPFIEDMPLKDTTFRAKLKEERYVVINSKGFDIAELGKHFGMFNEINLKSEVLYPARIDGNYGAIDRFGKTKIPFGKYPCIHNFYKTITGKVFGVIADGINVGLIDSDGNIIIPFDYGYEDVMWVDNDTLITNKNGKWGVIDRDNNIITPFEYDYIDFMREGYRYVKKDNKYGFIDKDNKILKLKI